jgi:hypothetical protein
MSQTCGTQWPVFVHQAFWITAKPSCLQIVYDSLHVSTAELSSYKKDQMACKT